MKSMVALFAVVTLLLAERAQAEVRCVVPMTDWQPREAVEKLAATNGWTLRRIKIDDGCYEIVGADAGGHNFDLKLHPGTLAVMARGQELEKDEHEKHYGN